MILHDYLPSGNGYKVRLLLTQLGFPFRRIGYDVARGGTRTLGFLAEINPNGRVPVLEIDDETLAESGAIRFYLAEGTTFLPSGRLDRARVLQWMFFEQYSHSSQNARAWVQRSAGRGRHRAPRIAARVGCYEPAKTQTAPEVRFRALAIGGSLKLRLA